MSLFSRSSKDLHSAQYTVKLLYLELLVKGRKAHEIVPAILPSYSSFNIEPDWTVTVTHIFNMAEYLEQMGFDMVIGTWKVKMKP